METNVETYCRVCTSNNIEMISIFDYYRFCEHYLQIFQVITKCASVQIQKLDGYPERICKSCIEHLSQAFSFKQLCEDSDYKFRHDLVAGLKTFSQHDYCGDVMKIQCAAAAIYDNEVTEKLSCSDVGPKIKSEYPEEIIKENPSCSTDVEFFEIKTELVEDEKIEDSILENRLLDETIASSSRDFTTFQSLKRKLSERLQKTPQPEFTIPLNPLSLEASDTETKIPSVVVKNEIQEVEDEELNFSREIKSEFHEETDVSTNGDSPPQLGLAKPTVPSLFCEVCGKGFRRVTELKNHMRSHSEKTPYICEICGKNCGKQSALITHRRTHTGEKPFKCETCGKCFNGNGKLNIHKRTHTGEKPYQCDACGKCFHVKEKLNIHKRIHTGEKPYKCEICDKYFTQQSALISHNKIHTDHKPYKCENCDKAFRHHSALIIHNKIHTGEKPYKCETCGAYFRQHTALIDHNKIHTGEKPYKCEVCTKCFSHRATFIAHKRIHTGEKPYKCETCGKCFNQKTKLNRHNRIHTGEQPYKCEICDRAFRDKKTLTNHETIHVRDAFLQS